MLLQYGAVYHYSALYHYYAVDHYSAVDHYNAVEGVLLGPTDQLGSCQTYFPFLLCFTTGTVFTTPLHASQMGCACMFLVEVGFHERFRAPHASC